MIRTKGEPGTGNVVEAVTHMRAVTNEIRRLTQLGEEQLMATARDLGAPFELVKEIHETGKLPVVNFAAGGIATPSDAALMMALGCDGIFVGSGIFKSEDPSGLRPGDRRGDHVLGRRRGRGQGLAGSGRGDARPRDRQDSGRREDGGAGLVSQCRQPGSWHSKETSANT